MTTDRATWLRRFGFRSVLGHARAHRLPAAIGYWQKAMDVDPKNQEAFVNLLRAKAMLR